VLTPFDLNSKVYCNFLANNFLTFPLSSPPMTRLSFLGLKAIVVTGETIECLQK
jgi:hypothetical protein